MKQRTTFISERGLVARINRVLSKQNEALRKTRQDSRWSENRGCYYRIDYSRNLLIDSGYSAKDLEQLAKELNCIDKNERLLVD